MELITNDKVSPLTLPTGDCRGVTVLFNHPGGQLVNIAQKVYRLQCAAAEDARMELYWGLRAAMAEIMRRETGKELGLAPIAVEAMHVTLADLVHPGNIAQIAEPARSEFQTFFRGLPASLRSGWPSVLRPVEIMLDSTFELRFAFKDLHFFGDALVALVRPADVESEGALAQVTALRLQIDEALRAIGKPPNGRFTPHVTVCYSPNAASTAAAKADKSAWQAVFEKHTHAATVSVCSASIFGFTNMVEFVTYRPQAPPAFLLSADALARDPRLQDPKHGDRKILVTTLYGSEQLASGVAWEPRPSGSQVEVVEHCELTYFTEKAPQNTHLHRKCTEIFTLLRGGPMEIEVAGQVHVLRAADSIVVHPGTVHCVRAGNVTFFAQVVAVNSAGSSDEYVVPPVAAGLSAHFNGPVPPLVPNLSLVAFRHRPKPPGLEALIARLIEMLRCRFGNLFTPYALSHIHSTLLGLEGVRIGGRLYNVNFAANYGREAAMDLDGLLSCARSLPNPITLRYGGFAPCDCDATARQTWLCHRGAGFHSCGQSSYNQSFLAERNGAVVITGWPVVRSNGCDEFPRTAYHFRRAPERFGILDKFHFECEHAGGFWENDDCGMTLGRLGEVGHNEIAAAEDEVRALLGAPNSPIYMDINPEDLSIVKYRDVTLRGCERIVPLHGIAVAELSELYADVGW